MQKLKTSKCEHDDVTIRIGLSSIFNDMRFYPKKFKEASTVLENSRFTNRGSVVFFDDLEETLEYQTLLTPENIKEIDHIVRFGTIDDIGSIFDKYIQLSKESQINDTEFQLFIVASANLMMNYAFSLGVGLQDHFKNGFITELLHFLSPAEILEYTKKEIIKLRKSVIKETNTKIMEVTDQVISYIDLNYKNNNMSLDKVSQKFNVSVSYLSSLLKKEKGISFNKYLVQVRIDKAKELLRYSDLKVVEVAKKVGYNDVYYFSHSFKKNTKMSPKEYREQV